MLRMFDFKKQISDLYLTLEYAACNDTFTSKYWPDLESKTPTQLEEDYFTCTMYWYDAVFDSLGIASVSTPHSYTSL
jgi:hypothetical protein